MKKKNYESPRICVYEVELQPVLAGSVTETKGSFQVESDVTNGDDDDDVWE